MSQNLVSLSFPKADVDAIDAALATLEEKLAHLIELSVADRRSLVKMGDKSEAFCRQTLIVLDQNRQILPPTFDLAEATQDLAALDLLRPRFQRLRQLIGKADDTEMALGSDVMSAALETLREAMSARYSRKPKASADVPARPVPPGARPSTAVASENALRPRQQTSPASPPRATARPGPSPPKPLRFAIEAARRDRKPRVLARKAELFDRRSASAWPQGGIAWRRGGLGRWQGERLCGCGSGAGGGEGNAGWRAGRW